ncbi:hypothetical protein FRC09_011106 [Ceratobasidium sp. 395]|nr:hypothetical protein FRC09_011106 [Ceratobasidium sp. 395]
MMFMTAPRLIAAAAWLAFASAQFTSVDPAGNSVIVSGSIDATGGTVPVAVGTVAPGTPGAPTPGAPPPAATTPVSTPASSPAPVPTSAPAATSTTPRVVGQPGPTAGEPGPTTYRYTTVDANGATVVLTDTYTPSYGVTTLSTVPPAGSIMPYDQYTAMYGGGSGGGGGGLGNSAARQYLPFGIRATVVMCILGGVTMLL